MINYDYGMRLKELAAEVKYLNQQIHELKVGIGINELWDNADIIRNWKVSERTLATWRKEGLIGYVKVGGMIWYTREQRDLFLNSNLNESKDGEEI